MRGFCSRCKEYRGEGEEWKIIIRRKDEFPTCEKCGSFVDVFDWGTKGYEA